MILLCRVYLRSVFDRSEGENYLSELSEEGFLFLTNQSDFWRNRKPIYSTLGERDKPRKGKRRSSSLNSR